MSPRVLFIGTSEFAAPSLEAVAAMPDARVVAVVTQPDRPKGRGRAPAESPVKQAAARLGLPVLQPDRVRARTFLREARALAPDLIALASFGQIIPAALLDLPPLGPVNVHASLLPAYRGAAPIQRALLAGEARTGVTTMWMEPTLDTGDILLSRQVEIAPDDDAGSLTDRLAREGADLLVETIRLLRDGSCPRTPQSDAHATWAPAIESRDAEVRWFEAACAVRNRVRAMSPRPGAVAALAGRRLKLWRADAEDGAAGGAPGEVLAVTRDGVVVATGVGVVTLREVQPENGRRMAASDWARGARVAPGACFHPSGEL